MLDVRPDDAIAQGLTDERQALRSHVMPDLDYQRRPVRRPRDAEARRVALWDWLTPLIMICGSALVLIAGTLIEAGSARWIDALGVGLVVFAIAVVKTIIAVAVAVGCSWVLGIGFDSLGRGTLRLAAIVLTATAIMAIIQPFIGCFSLLVYGGLLVVMLMTMLDLEQGEATAFTVAFVVVEIVALVFFGALGAYMS